MQVGDVVSMLDEYSDTYYAQIRGFLTDQYCEKSAVVTWLLPTKFSPPPKKAFDPATYVIGTDIVLSPFASMWSLPFWFRSRRGRAEKAGLHGVYNARSVWLLQVEDDALPVIETDRRSGLHLDDFETRPEAIVARLLQLASKGLNLFCMQFVFNPGETK